MYDMNTELYFTASYFPLLITFKSLFGGTQGLRNSSPLSLSHDAGACPCLMHGMAFITHELLWHAQPSCLALPWNAVCLNQNQIQTWKLDSYYNHITVLLMYSIEISLRIILYWKTAELAVSINPCCLSAINCLVSLGSWIWQRAWMNRFGKHSIGIFVV